MITLLTDPNVIYLLLVVGLWALVTAAHIPGTGVIELVALVMLASSAYLLTTVSSNWSSVVLMTVGAFGFLVMPFYKRHLTLLALAGLALQTIGGLFLFQGMAVSWLVHGLMIVLALVYYRFALMPALKMQDRLVVMGSDNQLLGANGRVVQPIDPLGTVNVRGELWTATSAVPLVAGVEVEVISRDGLRLVVQAAKRKREAADE